MKSEEELEAFFENELSPLIAPIEEYRIAKFRKLKIYLFSALGCSLLTVLGFITKEPFFIMILSIPMIAFLGSAFSLSNKTLETLAIRFKRDILPELLGFMFDDFEYIPRQKIAASVIEESLLFPFTITGVDGEDFMRFTIGETNIMFCETTLCSGNTKNEVSYIFISATFNKYFFANTLLLPRHFDSFFQNMKRHFFQNFNKIKLEDSDFEREFNVLSTDQVEARYILTPSLMQKILEYKMKVKKEIAISFVGNRLYCAIPEFKDLFEPAFSKSFDLGFIRQNYDPIKLYTDLVEDLNLNLRIWSRQ